MRVLPGSRAFISRLAAPAVALPQQVSVSQESGEGPKRGERDPVGGLVLRQHHVVGLEEKKLESDPILTQVAAVSCGIYEGTPVLDLDYVEDSNAHSDGNFVMTGAGQLIEVQMSAEGATFSRDQMTKLLDLAEAGAAELVAAQKAAI